MKKRILSWLLVLAMLLPILPPLDVYATGSTPASTPCGSDDYGHAGSGWIIGLGICDMEEYTGDAEDETELANWIDNYAQKYYTDIEGGYYYYPNQNDPLKSVPNEVVGGSYSNLISTGGDPLGILQSVANKTPNAYTQQVGNRIVVQPEKCAEVVASLYECNESLAAQWQNCRIGENKHPIVIVIEAVTVIKTPSGALHGYTVQSAASQYGFDISRILLKDTPTFPQYKVSGSSFTAGESYSAAVVYGLYTTSAAYALDSDATVGGKVIKSLFGIMHKPSAGRDYYLGGLEGYGNAGYSDLTNSDTAQLITGCNIVTVTGGGDTPPPNSDECYLYGGYEWDINAGKLPVNSRGYKEDATVEIAKGETVSDTLELGYIKLNKTAKLAWENYQTRYSPSSVELTFEVYGVTGPNFTTEQSKIKGNAGTGVCNTYTYTVSYSDFLKAFDTGYLPIQGADCLKGNINASPYQGTVAYAWATKLTARVSVGADAGKDISLSNNQTHYAVYTFKDVNRTYQFTSVKSGTKFPIQGWSELKTMALGGATYEATKGTPTTDNMFLSFGGNEYAVAMQYRYCIDDYIRSYQVVADPYPNYMYYDAVIYDEHTEKFETGVYKNIPGLHATCTTVPVLNMSFTHNLSAARSDQKNRFTEAVDYFFDEIDTIFTNIDTNSVTYPAKENYAVLVDKGTLKLDKSSGVISGIDDIEGNNDFGALDDTKLLLEQLSEKTQRLATVRNNIDSYLNSYNDADNYNFSTEIVFAQTTKGLDYDSDAYSKVTLTFEFVGDYVHYSSVSKSYDTIKKKKGFSIPWGWNCTCGESDNDTDSCSDHVSGNPCYHAVPEVGHPYSSGSPSCGSGCYKNHNHTLATDCEDHSVSGTASGSWDCSLHPHTHYGHNYPDSYLGTSVNSYTTQWDPQDRETNLYWNEAWRSIFIPSINVNYSADSEYYFANKTHDNKPMSLGKNLSYDSTMYQVYKDVKYMDIVDCHVWRLGGGVAAWDIDGGLSSLMCPINGIDPAILKIACANQGYTLYNTDAVLCKGFWDDSFTTDSEQGVSISEGAWRAVPEEWAKTVDPLEEPVYGGNTELQAIGRLANSYHGGSKDPTVPAGITTGARIGDAEHGLLLEATEDAVVLRYNIEEQGGRSHYSFPGFMKQALALAFYKNEEPTSAYKNNIAVMSDTLALGDAGNITLNGFHWDTTMFNAGMDGSNKPDAQTGRTCAILSTQSDLSSSMLCNYYKIGDNYWTKAGSITDIEVNTETKGLNKWDIKGSTIANGKCTASTDTPITPLEGMENFQEGGEGEEVNKPGQIRLETYDAYKAYDVKTVNESETDTVNLTNFFSSVKDGLNSPAENVMPVVGYVGAQDSIQDLHQYTLADGFSSGYDKQAGLDKMTEFGAVQPGSHLLIVPGSTGALNGGSGDVYTTGGLFPFMNNLNVERNKGNNSYGGYPTALFYDKCAQMFRSYPGVTSIVTDYVNGAQAGVLDSYEKDANESLSLDLSLEDMFFTGEGNHLGGAGFLQGVGYGGATVEGKTNAVTIFNPISNSSFRILNPSDMLPDALNSGEYGNPRDQRIAISYAGDGTNNIALYGSYLVEDSPLTYEETVNTLKMPSDIETSYYTKDDYGLLDLEKQCSIIDSSNSFVVTKDGSYVLSVMGLGDKYTSVTLYLYQGDVVTTDGTSIYLERFNSVEPYCDFAYLNGYIKDINLSQDSADYAEQLETVTERAEDFLLSVEKELLSLEALITSLPLSVSKSNLIELDNCRHRLENIITTFNNVYSISGKTVVTPYSVEYSMLQPFFVRCNTLINKLNAINVTEFVPAETLVTRPFNYELSFEFEYNNLPNMYNICECEEGCECETSLAEDGTLLCKCKYLEEKDSKDSEFALVSELLSTSSLEEEVSDLYDLVPSTYINNVTEVGTLISRLETILSCIQESSLYDEDSNTLCINYAHEGLSVFTDLNNLITEVNSIATCSTEGTSTTNVVGLYSNIPTLSLSLEEDSVTTDSTVRKGTKFCTDLTGCNTEAGTMISIELPLNANYDRPTEINVSSSGVKGIDYIVTDVSYGNKVKYLIECLTDVTLGEVFIEFTKDVQLQEFAGSCINYEKIWLADTGATWVDTACITNTTQHDYLSGSEFYKENSARRRCINGAIFTSTVDWAYGIVSGFGNGKVAAVREVEGVYGLTKEALSNPHKVYNANWRYYVVGWQTSTGAVITSPDDALLYNDATILCWPSGIGTITVKDLKEQACLVKYNNELYLTTVVEGLEHHILENNAVVTSYDTWTLGSGIKAVTPVSEDKYPLICNAPVKSVDDEGMEYSTYTDTLYEFFFRLSDVDVCLFDVQYAEHADYRFTSNAKTRYINGVDNDSTFDWSTEKVQHTIQSIKVNGEEQKGSSDYISLDDEFYVYCDNTGEFPGDNTQFDSYVDGVNGTLGYGWDTDGLRYYTDKDRAGSISAFLTSTYPTKTLSRDYTETSTWIAEKCIKFDKDVYVALEGSKIKPTKHVVGSDSIKFIPAGEEIPLGYAYSSCSCTSDMIACNHGGFHDYGEPGETDLRDEKGNILPYTYCFYLPLSAGETPLHAEIITRAINKDSDDAYNRENDRDAVVTDAEVVTNNMPVNVVGRIGALTIADTGDPRYSDTFKVASDEYLIYPIVRKILEYSNKYVENTKYEAVKGSQRGVVLDPFDVRGRIAEVWAAQQVAVRSSSYNGYNVYSMSSYNTYLSQWFKDNLTKADDKDIAGVQHGAILPLSSDFNKHETFKTQPLKVGYELYLSLEAIGQYVSNGVIVGEEVNGNNDSGDRLVQIRPFYSAVDAVDGDGNTYEGAVDVYMRNGDNYVLINWGCDNMGAVDGETAGSCTDVTHNATNLFEVVQHNAFPYYIQTNTSGTLMPDESLQRRMVTDEEAVIYSEILNKLSGGIRTVFEQSQLNRSILTNWDNSVKDEDGNDVLGGLELDTRYSYGNSQMLFLRDRNMTYVGGPSVALKYNLESFNSKKFDTRYNGQKYYFGLGLPSSAVFVPHGKSLSQGNILKTGYVLSSIDVIAIGDVWNLHYMSDISKMTWSVNGTDYEWKDWNPYWNVYPWLIPVTYYDIEQTSLDDVDTEGSH